MAETFDFVGRIFGAGLYLALVGVFSAAFVDGAESRGDRIAGWVGAAVCFGFFGIIGGLVLWADSGA